MNPKLDKRLNYNKDTGSFEASKKSNKTDVEIYHEERERPWPTNGVLPDVVKEALEAFKQGRYEQWLIERRKKQQQKGDK